MELHTILNRLFKEISIEVKNNPDFSRRIATALNLTEETQDKKKSRPPRRNPGPFDPIVLFREQPESLKPRLEVLTIEEIKDIIAEHAMDRKKLAMRWKDKNRLIDLIITTTKNRAQKGDAFRNIQTQDRKKEESEPESISKREPGSDF